jgi:hypothetical protein
MEASKLMAWVTETGEYGGGELLTFGYAKLTEEQWDKLDVMAHYDRFEYVSAILDGNKEVIATIEERNFG